MPLRPPVGTVRAGVFSPLPSSSTMKNLVFPGTETTIFSFKARLSTSCSPAKPAFDAMRSRNRMLLLSWPFHSIKTRLARLPGTLPWFRHRSKSAPEPVSIRFLPKQTRAGGRN